MKIPWIYGLLFVFSMVAYGQITIAHKDAAEPLSDTQRLLSDAPPRPSLKRSVGDMISDSGDKRDSTRSSATQARRSANNDNNVAASAPEYVLLHQLATQAFPFVLQGAGN